MKQKNLLWFERLGSGRSGKSNQLVRRRRLVPSGATGGRSTTNILPPADQHLTDFMADLDNLKLFIYRGLPCVIVGFSSYWHNGRAIEFLAFPGPLRHLQNDSRFASLVLNPKHDDCPAGGGPFLGFIERWIDSIGLGDTPNDALFDLLAKMRAAIASGEDNRWTPTIPPSAPGLGAVVQALQDPDPKLALSILFELCED